MDEKRHGDGDALWDLLRWFKTHSVYVATKHDLEQMEQRIMATLQDLTAAATALSTTADGLSVKLDDLVTKVDALIDSLSTASLPPDAVNALSSLKTSRDKAAAQGDKVDAEIAKVDKVLPTPAPPAP